MPILVNLPGTRVRLLCGDLTSSERQRTPPGANQPPPSLVEGTSFPQGLPAGAGAPTCRVGFLVPTWVSAGLGKKAIALEGREKPWRVRDARGLC